MKAAVSDEGAAVWPQAAGFDKGSGGVVYFRAAEAESPAGPARKPQQKQRL
jgi:hypothetical protein